MSSFVAVLSCSLFQETLKATTYTVDILLSVEDRSGPIIIIESNVEVILFMSSDFCWFMRRINSSSGFFR